MICQAGGQPVGDQPVGGLSAARELATLRTFLVFLVIDNK
jgi:hypothetical protein